MYSSSFTRNLGRKQNECADGRGTKPDCILISLNVELSEEQFFNQAALGGYQAGTMVLIEFTSVRVRHVQLISSSPWLIEIYYELINCCRDGS